MFFQSANVPALFGVFLSWLGFIGPMLSHRAQAEAATPQSQDGRHRFISLVGIAIQGVGFWFVFLGLAMARLTFVGGQGLIETAVPVFLALSAVVIFNEAYRVLGANWSLIAKAGQSQTLITVGPYAWIRHPIYLAILLMLIALALAVGRPEMLIVALPAYYIGTVVRTWSEESMLRARFGEDYDRYAKNVARLIPGVW